MCCCEGRQCLWQALVAAVRCREVGLVGLFMGHAWRLVCGGLPGASPVLVGAVALRIGALHLWVGLECVTGDGTHLL